MKIKIIISILILSIFFSGCIDDSISTPQKINDTIMISIANTDGVSMISPYKILNSNMIEIDLVGIKIVFDRVQ